MLLPQCCLMGNMWAVFHNSAVTKNSQLVAGWMEPQTREDRTQSSLLQPPQVTLHNISFLSEAVPSQGICVSLGKGFFFHFLFTSVIVYIKVFIFFLQIEVLLISVSCMPLMVGGSCSQPYYYFEIYSLYCMFAVGTL